MPAMPRTSKKAQRIVEKIIGKPENQLTEKTVYKREPVDGINRSLDSWYNHKI